MLHHTNYFYIESRKLTYIARKLLYFSQFKCKPNRTYTRKKTHTHVLANVRNIGVFVNIKNHQKLRGGLWVGEGRSLENILYPKILHLKKSRKSRTIHSRQISLKLEEYK